MGGLPDVAVCLALPPQQFFTSKRGRHIIESDQIGEQQLMRSVEHAKSGAFIIAQSHIFDAVCSCISGHLQADGYHKIGLPLTAPGRE